MAECSLPFELMIGGQSDELLALVRQFVHVRTGEKLQESLRPWNFSPGVVAQDHWMAGV